MSPFAETLAAGLMRTSLEGALVIALIALLVRALPALPARWRCGLWWAAGLKLVAGLALAVAGADALELAVLPETGGASITRAASPGGSSADGPGAEPGAARSTLAGPSDVAPAALSPAGAAGVTTHTAGAASRPARHLVVTAACALWLAGVVLLAAVALLRRRRLSALLRRAEPVGDPAARSLLHSLAGRSGVEAPPLLASAEVATPQLVGALRPRLLLPSASLAGDAPMAGGCGTSSRALEMILAHELAHLRRRDLLWGWVPALARLLFFFHPLVPFAVREYVLAREAACDAEVLRVVHASPRDYGRLLLRWGAAAADGGGRGTGRHLHPMAATLGHPRQLKRRLLMLHQTTTRTDTSRRWRRWLPLAAALPVLLALLPVRLVAAPGPLAENADGHFAAETAGAAGAAAGAQETAEATEAPAAAETAGAPEVAGPATAPAAATRATGTTWAVATAEPATAPFTARSAPTVAFRVASASPAPVVAAADDDGDEGYAYSYSTGGGDREAVIYLQGDDHSVGFSSSSGQWDRVRDLQRGDEPLLWFERDGRHYVIRDPALLAEVEAAYAPMMELGEQQGALGAEQGELGGEQGQLGGRQGELGAQQGELAARQAALGAELAKLSLDRSARALEGDEPSAAERQRMRQREGELRDRMEALRDEMHELGDRQRDLGAEQRALGEKQRALGDRQRELGDRQRQASEAARPVVRDVIDRAFAAGKVEEVD